MWQDTLSLLGQSYRARGVAPKHEHEYTWIWMTIWCDIWCYLQGLDSQNQAPVYTGGRLSSNIQIVENQKSYENHWNLNNSEINVQKC